MFFKEKKIHPDRIRKILIIRIDRIGDLVYTVPAISTLRENFPMAHITALLSPLNKELLENTGIIDDVILWEPIYFRKNWQFFRDLRERKFDLVLIFSPMDETYLLASMTGAPVRAGIVVRRRILIRPYASLCLTHTYILDQEGKMEKHEPATHEVEKCLGLLALLGIEKIEREISLHFPSHIVAECKEAIRNWIINYKGIIGLPVCRKFSPAGLGDKEIYALSEEIKKNFPDYLLFITYGKEEEEKGRFLEEKFDGREGIIIKGFLPLQLWAAFMQNLSLVISIDTSAVHLAASGKVPVIALYPHKLYPLCRHEWTPWKTEHKQIIIEDFRQTVEEIIRGSAYFLRRAGEREKGNG